MIQLVLEAIRSSKSVDRILVAVSSNCPQTARKARELGAEVIETPGTGYENDMKAAIRQQGLGDVLVVSSDLPFLTGVIVDQAVEEYRDKGKPALSVMCPLTVFRKRGLPASYVFDVDGNSLVPIGVNIVNGSRIDQPTLEETVLITDSEELAFNVNSPEELEVARRFARRQKTRENLTNAK
jgi:adenosylcobinamide-phosphate guanylyltransferase